MELSINQILSTPTVSAPSTLLPLLLFLPPQATSAFHVPSVPPDLPTLPCIQLPPTLQGWPRPQRSLEPTSSALPLLLALVFYFLSSTSILRYVPQ